MPYNQDPCEFRFSIHQVTRVVDGDTIDAVFDLGFDTMTKQRIRLLGIDTPESRTSDAVEKKYGLLSKKKLSEWIHIEDAELECRCQERDSRGKFGRVLGEIWVKPPKGEWTNVNQWLVDNHYAVGYCGENKMLVEEEHLKNREHLKDEIDHD
jgi:micrococcal nuclease